MNYTEEEAKLILANTAEDFMRLGVPFYFIFYPSGASEPAILENGIEGDRMSLLEFLVEHLHNESLAKTNEIMSLKKQIETFKRLN